MFACVPCPDRGVEVYVVAARPVKLYSVLSACGTAAPAAEGLAQVTSNCMFAPTCAVTPRTSATPHTLICSCTHGTLVLRLMQQRNQFEGARGRTAVLVACALVDQCTRRLLISSAKAIAAR